MRDIHQIKLLIFIIAAIIFSLLISSILFLSGIEINIIVVALILGVSIIFVTTLYLTIYLVDKNFLKEINEALEKVGKGELTSGKISFEGAFAIKIRKNLDSFIDFLSDTLKKIEFSVLDINGNASTLSMFSENISERIANERDTINEITKSMTELKAIADSIKEYATIAKDLSVKNRERIFNSTESIKNLIQSMNEISESSSSINEVAKFIAEVADETNLLALNASIEASRAGAEGAGFSIVASEIRNLAENSSSAIKKITDTVDRLIKSVSKGVNFSNEANEALNDIITGINDTAKTIEEIDSKITTQTQVTGQIYDEIENVNKLVIQNSELLIEMLTSIQNLSKQSDILKEIASSFKKEHQDDMSNHIFGVENFTSTENKDFEFSKNIGTSKNIDTTKEIDSSIEIKDIVPR
ncbi:MAG: hypothetical protein GYA61_03060 [Spirochaetales bacterium]|jgi:methyl-accepting chemotaxis protein|nr:methyl-accepting chemotaxis protein [Exilispira sp.]NMC67184.1 hypothetical protein [Spirochaetales bacterium]